MGLAARAAAAAAEIEERDRNRCIRPEVNCGVVAIAAVDHVEATAARDVIVAVAAVDDVAGGRVENVIVEIGQVDLLDVAEHCRCAVAVADEAALGFKYLENIDVPARALLESGDKSGHELIDHVDGDPGIGFIHCHAGGQPVDVDDIAGLEDDLVEATAAGENVGSEVAEIGFHCQRVVIIAAKQSVIASAAKQAIIIVAARQEVVAAAP